MSIAGRIGTVEISSTSASAGFVTLGGLADATFNPSKDMLESTNKDDGDYKSFIDGHKEATMDLSCRWDESDAGQNKVRDAYFGNTSIWARWRMEVGSGTLKECIAQCRVATLTEGQPIGDVAGLDVSLQITGSFAEATQP